MLLGTKLVISETSPLANISAWYLIQFSPSSMHHYECVALCKDISLQRGRFCTRSLASSIPRSSKDRSSWIFFIQVVRGRPSGRLQFSGGGSQIIYTYFTSTLGLLTRGSGQTSWRLYVQLAYIGPARYSVSYLFSVHHYHYHHLRLYRIFVVVITQLWCIADT